MRHTLCNLKVCWGGEGGCYGCFIDRDTSLNATVVRLEFVLDWLLVFGCMSSSEGHWLSLIRDGIGNSFVWLIRRMHLALIVCVCRSL